MRRRQGVFRAGWRYAECGRCACPIEPGDLCRYRGVEVIHADYEDPDDTRDRGPDGALEDR